MWSSSLKTWCLLLLFILAGCGISSRSSSALARAHITSPGNLSSTSMLARFSDDFSKFVGTWTAHGVLLVVSSDGTATFVARTYNWCIPGVSSRCDSIDAQGHIQDGYRERLQFSSASGSIAHGTVTSSNFHPTGLAVTLTLQPGDTLIYASGLPIAFLCGPASTPGACGA